MKVIQDGKGKHIIDFEGVVVGFDLDPKCGIKELFNDKTVSNLQNATFLDLNIPEQKARFEKIKLFYVTE